MSGLEGQKNILSIFAVLFTDIATPPPPTVLTVLEHCYEFEGREVFL